MDASSGQATPVLSVCGLESFNLQMIFSSTNIASEYMVEI
jgi:hypothetical protein